MSCSTIVMTEKEAKDFNDKKTSAFQGTMILCGVYAIIAIILLLLINYTSFGKDIIYNKFMPFVITYVFGAIFIIIYLVFTIYNLEPSKERNPQNNDIICPDYWKIKELTSQEINYIKGNISNTSNLSDDDIRYKCEIDKNITPLSNYKSTNSELNNGYIGNYLSTGNDKDTPNFLYVNYKDDNKEIKKYAQIAGIYNKNNGAGYSTINVNSLSSNLNSSKTIVPINSSTTDYPLICNEVYPQYLSKLDEKDGGNKNRCEYAKKCNIAWNDIGC